MVEARHPHRLEERRGAMSLTIGSLFSGIGGLELGLERAGLGPVKWQVEIDPFCRSVLAKHWPEVKRYEDVRSVGGELEPVDIICGGFPCQDVSSAGKRAGLAGARSGLWREYARIVASVRPRWVVVENVASGAKLWIDAVRSELERLGYESLPVPLAAADVGAPHLRRRIFLVAHADTHGQHAVSLDAEVAIAQAIAYSERERLREQQGRRSGSGWADASESRNDGEGGTSPDANGERLQGAEPVSRPKPRPSTAERAWSDDAMPKPALCRVDDGPSAWLDRNERIKSLGNAVVPQCAEVIGWVVRELAGLTPTQNRRQGEE